MSRTGGVHGEDVDVTNELCSAFAPEVSGGGSDVRAPFAHLQVLRLLGSEKSEELSHVANSLVGVFNNAHSELGCAVPDVLVERDTAGRLAI